MTHEELINELYEVSAFLLKKADLLKKHWSFNEPERKWELNLENKDDISIFHALMRVCEYAGIQRLYDIKSGYLDSDSFNEYRYKAGDEVRARMRQEEAE